LSKHSEAKFAAKAKRLEEERKMALISPTIELALEEGKLSEALQIVKRQLNRRTFLLEV